MFPLLILREEIVCLVILVFLALLSRTYRMGKDGRRFNLILAFSLAHVILDGVTVWTVNHSDMLSPVVNDLAHWLFFLSAILFGTEIFRYVLNTCYPGLKRGWHAPLLAPAGIYLLLLVAGVLKTEYNAYQGTRLSEGSGPVVGFVLCFVMFITAVILILVNRKKVSRHIKIILLPVLSILIIAEIIQVAVKEFLFTGGAITVVTVAFFFTLENPAAVLERKIMMDAISGLGTRSGYERDMIEYEREFESDKSISFTFMFIDINNLRSVNGLYGHQEGDTYISDVAVLLMNNLKSAARIYRMGGDEFLAVYRKTDEKTIVKDIKRVHDACRVEGLKKSYAPELAIGYAISDEKYNNLRDVLRVSDYMMYRNKADLKQAAAAGIIHETGTRLNLSGLTDRVYDAMCLTSDRFYPYILNTETGVTRISPAMVEFFGLEGEFIIGFEDIWNARIHPDDLEAYVTDLRAAIRGTREYHFSRYRVKDKEGNYVEVTCRGGLYHGRDGEPDIFCGYIVNHGLPEVIDSATGLKNHTVMYERLDEAAKTRCEAIVMKMDTMNISRIRMLYGSAAVGTVVRSLAVIAKKALHGKGEIFSRNGGNFIFYMPGFTREEANKVYQRIREQCAAGITVGETVIPVGVSAGAVELPAESLTNADAIRGAALFAAEEAWSSPQDTILFYRTEKEKADEEMSLLRIIHSDCLTDRAGFFLRFQPIVQSGNSEVTGAEALLRWHSDEHGEVPPGRFISFLENDPAYTMLGYDIIRMAVREARKIRETLPGFNINVNITAMQLYADDFIPNVIRILDEEAFPADHLILELTERCKEMEFDYLKEKVEDLKKTGIQVALDDMGTGFSTLDLLLHLPVNEIKLDMAFTNELTGNENNEMFAQVLCRIAERNDMAVCFEGVETEQMKDYLYGYGNVLLQGYYFDKPLRSEEFEKKYC